MYASLFIQQTIPPQQSLLPLSIPNRFTVCLSTDYLTPSSSSLCTQALRVLARLSHHAIGHG
jgi:hypothetical protein